MLIQLINLGNGIDQIAVFRACLIEGLSGRVEEKVGEFVRLQQSRQSVPLIRALRDEGERARRQVLENAMKQLAKGASAEEVLERLSIQLTNKLLHSPTQTLNKAGSENSNLVDAVAQIYQLDQHD